MNEKTKFYILLGLLILSMAVAYFINSSFSQALSSQFS